MSAVLISCRCYSKFDNDDDDNDDDNNDDDDDGRRRRRTTMASYHNSRTTQLVGCFSLSFVDLVDVEVDLCCMSVDVVVVWVFCSLCDRS